MTKFKSKVGCKVPRTWGVIQTLIPANKIKSKHYDITIMEFSGRSGIYYLRMFQERKLMNTVMVMIDPIGKAMKEVRLPILDPKKPLTIQLRSMVGHTSVKVECEPNEWED